MLPPRIRLIWGRMGVWLMGMRVSVRVRLRVAVRRSRAAVS